MILNARYIRARILALKFTGVDIVSACGVVHRRKLQDQAKVLPPKRNSEPSSKAWTSMGSQGDTECKMKRMNLKRGPPLVNQGCETVLKEPFFS